MKLNSMKLTKFGTISENEDGDIVISNFEFECDEEKTLNRVGDVSETEVLDLIIERIVAASKPDK